jgi:hypothetical protein
LLISDAGAEALQVVTQAESKVEEIRRIASVHLQTFADGVGRTAERVVGAKVMLTSVCQELLDRFGSTDDAGGTEGEQAPGRPAEYEHSLGPPPVLLPEGGEEPAAGRSLSSDNSHPVNQARS